MKLKENLSHEKNLTLNSASLEELKWCCYNVILNKGKPKTGHNLNNSIGFHKTMEIESSLPGNDSLESLEQGRN